MSSKEAVLESRLTDEYLKKEGWENPTEAESEFNELALLIPTSFKYSVRANWIAIKKGGHYPSMHGDSPKFAVSFLYELSTNHPLVVIDGREVGARSSMTKYIPKNDRIKSLIDPSKLIRGLSIDQDLVEESYNEPSNRKVNTSSLGIFNTGLFLNQDQLINFYDPKILLDRESAFYDSLPMLDGSPKPVNPPTFDSSTTIPQFEDLKSRYYVAPTTEIEFLHSERADNPRSSFMPRFKMRVNRNYLKVELKLAEIKPEIEERLKKSPAIRYLGRIALLQSEIFDREAELYRLRSILSLTNGDSIKNYILRQREITEKVESLPNLFPKGHQYWQMEPFNF